MEDKESIYGKLNEQQLIFRHLDRLSKLSSNIQDTRTDKWSIYAHQFMFSVNHLESLLEPLKDSNYRERVKEIEKEQEERDISRWEKKIWIHNAKLDELIKLMYRNNFYMGKTDEFVIDKAEEDSNDLEIDKNEE